MAEGQEVREKVGTVLEHYSDGRLVVEVDSPDQLIREGDTLVLTTKVTGVPVHVEVRLVEGSDGNRCTVLLRPIWFAGTVHRVVQEGSYVSDAN